MRLLILISLIFLTACNGRYASLHNTMNACGYKTISYSEFHQCMKDKVAVSKDKDDGYYYKTSQEITATLDNVGGRIESGELSEEEAFNKFNSFVSTKIIEDQQSANQVAAIGSAVLLGAAAAATYNNYQPASGYYYDTPYMCTACPTCSPQCNIGKACGKTCISVLNTCHVGRGTACNLNARVYP